MLTDSGAIEFMRSYISDLAEFTAYGRVHRFDRW